MEREEILKQLAVPLLIWYDDNKRVLPWRENASPYRVWVSEIMLQQTRVEAVKPYFERFIDTLPKIGDLACVEEQVLLKLWEGLGYYNRARNLKKAAEIVDSDYLGVLPDNYELLLTLPGIGNYTAGAIASIAYGKKAAAVDGNVLRVLSRVTADDTDILNPALKRQIENEILQIIPDNRPGDFNQALMELGATVCLPNGLPKCDTCPWQPFCVAEKTNRVMDLPKRAPKKKRRIEEKTILIIRDSEKCMINKRDSKGLLAGMYEFPNKKGHLTQDEVLDYVKKLQLSPVRIQKLNPAKHIFSHVEWEMVAYLVRVEDIETMKLNSKTNHCILVEFEKTKREYPIPSAFEAYKKIAFGDTF